MTEQQPKEPWQFVIEKCQRLKNGCNDIRVSRGVIEQHLDDLMAYAENQAGALTLAEQLENGQREKPAVFYCENGKSLEGLEQGALAVLSNLMIRTNAKNATFTIGNEKDGSFTFTARRSPI